MIPERINDDAQKYLAPLNGRTSLYLAMGGSFDDLSSYLIDDKNGMLQIQTPVERFRFNARDIDLSIIIEKEPSGLDFYAFSPVEEGKRLAEQYQRAFQSSPQKTLDSLTSDENFGHDFGSRKKQSISFSTVVYARIEENPLEANGMPMKDYGVGITVNALLGHVSPSAVHGDFMGLLTHLDSYAAQNGFPLMYGDFN